MSDDRIGTADTMRGRAEENRLKLYLLLRTNRLVLTGLFGLVVFGLFMGWSVALDPPLPAILRSADTIETLFSALLGVLVTGTTLVVSISQLVLSQENGPLGDQHRRMSGTMDVRSFTAEITGDVVAPDPATFLSDLLGAVERRARALEGAVSGTDDPALERQVSALVESITGNAVKTRRELEGTEFGSFDVLFAALDFNYGIKIHHVERIATEFDTELDERQQAAFDSLKTALTMFAPAREHVKTLYFQWALVSLSQYILYLTVLALVVAGGMLVFVRPGTFGPARFLGIPVVTWVVGAAFTVTLLPFFLFTAYVLRIAVIARRTVAIGPLVLRNTRR